MLTEITQIESVLDIDCSMFTSVTDTIPANVNLLQWLTDDKYLPMQNKLRELTDEVERGVAKLNMPCITPSGIFLKRGKDHLLKHTRLIAIDIDKKDNLHLSNFSNLKAELSKIKNIAYCGLSVSGSGYWVIVPILMPEKHEGHFKQIEQWFASKGIVIDAACKDVSRLRIYSYDSKAYFNHAAKPLQAIYSPPPAIRKEYKQKQFNGQDKPVWELYNESDDFINVLLCNGWNIDCRKGQKIYFTRPSKKSGISAEFDRTKNVFYVFSSNANPFEAGRGYGPFQVYSILQHDGNGSKAAKALKAGSSFIP